MSFVSIAVEAARVSLRWSNFGANSSDVKLWIGTERRIFGSAERQTRSLIWRESWESSGLLAEGENY